MTTPVQFSVVVPVYNAVRLLPAFRRLVDSVFWQSFPGWELILVDDASTDDTAAVLREYAARDGRVRIHTHKSNRRQGMARNSGTAIARGDYVFYCDYDDYLLPEALSATKAIVERFNGPDIVQFHYTHFPGQFFDSSQIISMKAGNWWKPACRLYRGDIILRRHLYGRTSPTSWARAIRVELARQVKFPQELPEDFPHSLELYARAQSVAVSRKIIYAYLTRSESDGGSRGPEETLRNWMVYFTRDYPETMSRHQTLKRMPRAHRIHCLRGILTCSALLSEFNPDREAMLCWGRIVDSVGFPHPLTIAHYLWRSLGHGKFFKHLGQVRAMYLYRRLCRRLSRQADSL